MNDVKFVQHVGFVRLVFMSSSSINYIKHSFFNSKANTDPIVSYKADEFSLSQLRTEFSSLYQVFLSNRQYWLTHPELIIYMYYICQLLITYYDYDQSSTELHKYKELRKKTSNSLSEHSNGPYFIYPGLDETQANTHVRRLKRQIHPSHLKKKVSIFNNVRAHFNYSRNLATNLVQLMSTNFIGTAVHDVNLFFGNQFYFGDGLRFLENSRDATAMIGIVLNSIRLVLNLYMTISHIINSLYHDELSTKKVLLQELTKRAFSLINDLVWTTISLLSTFKTALRISSASMSSVVFAFLVFDILLIQLQWHLASHRCSARLDELNLQEVNASPLERQLIARQRDVLIDELELQCATYIVSVLAAIILTSCFALTLFYTGIISLSILSCFSMLGNAINNSLSDYQNYYQKQIMLERERANGRICNDAHHQELMIVLQADSVAAFKNFRNELIFNSCGITFIMCATIAFWPIAVCFTVSYISYQIYHNHQKQKASTHPNALSHDIYRFLDSADTPGQPESVSPSPSL